MSGCVMWTLLCVSCMAGYVTGQLHEPSNVTVESRNLSLFLTWLPAPENPSTVTYEVEYTNFTDDDVNDSYRWTHVPVCKNISVTQCDFTCALKMWDLNHSVRVRSIFSSRSSSWVQISNIQYLFTVDPDPPILTVTQGDGFVTVNTSTMFPLCLPQIIFMRSLSYFVMMMKNNNPNEVILEQELDRPSITMKTLGYKGEYCVAAKTKFITDTDKLSKFSNPVCFNVTEKDESYHAAYFAGLPIFTIIAVISYISFLIWHTITEKSKTPKVLDFSDGKYGEKNLCFPKQYAENFYSLNIDEITEQDTSTKFLIPNKHDGGVNIYPIVGQGYMERPTMLNSGSDSKEYFSSKDLASNSSSDKSSSGCTCPNTSGSVTDMASKDMNDQVLKIQRTVSGDGQMFSSTSMSVSEHIDSVSILDHNSLANIPLETLFIGGSIDDDMGISDGESSNQCFTDSEDGLDSLSTGFSNYKMSDFNHPSQDEKLQKDFISDYTQRTYTSKRC
ncbi:interferon lambda receptor 1 isoform X1 [Ranitomeya imitator]|uniref:interferon lambda receptor 1 isoform X1 n=2 Tax=Ranitomeya imitator TaxID=111125 RepID=UPI0037E7A261